MRHPFQPVETPDALTSPVGGKRRDQLAEAAAQLLAPAARLFHALTPRQWWTWLVLLLGTALQLVLLFLVGELVDLCISLMEIWAELARKHLELTL